MESMGLPRLQTLKLGLLAVAFLLLAGGAWRLSQLGQLRTTAEHPTPELFNVSGTDNHKFIVKDEVGFFRFQLMFDPSRSLQREIDQLPCGPVVGSAITQPCGGEPVLVLDSTSGIKLYWYAATGFPADGSRQERTISTLPSELGPGDRLAGIGDFLHVDQSITEIAVKISGRVVRRFGPGQPRPCPPVFGSGIQADCPPNAQVLPRPCPPVFGSGIQANCPPNEEVLREVSFEKILDTNTIKAPDFKTLVQVFDHSPVGSNAPTDTEITVTLRNFPQDQPVPANRNLIDHLRVMLAATNLANGAVFAPEPNQTLEVIETQFVNYNEATGQLTVKPKQALKPNWRYFAFVEPTSDQPVGIGVDTRSRMWDFTTGQAKQEEPKKEEPKKDEPKQEVKRPRKPSIEKVEALANNKLLISGKAEPNATVVIRIESNPIILITRADTQGQWSYTYEGPLEPGSHKVTVTTEKDGQTSETSNELAFSVPAPPTGTAATPTPFPTVSEATTPAPDLVASPAARRAKPVRKSSLRDRIKRVIKPTPPVPTSPPPQVAQITPTPEAIETPLPQLTEEPPELPTTEPEPKPARNFILPIVTIALGVVIMVVALVL